MMELFNIFKSALLCKSGKALFSVFSFEDFRNVFSRSQLVGLLYSSVCTIQVDYICLLTILNYDKIINQVYVVIEIKL